ncbi:hypothetical protein yberc0001_14190 [Yersinia bercovieri ATCC 43970]|uniref:Uncharacterized protein n=1 Tax=Yersinia bercovieri ATCC 43970 TaxID=349968 RepID=A0ABP2EAN0_YERBE|nr:hypothetical protein yberc0001_14190 [Yersinia bercovieri ATCC 43970]
MLLNQPNFFFTVKRYRLTLFFTFSVQLLLNFIYYSYIDDFLFVYKYRLD